MDTITLEKQDNRVVISIDENYLSQSTINKLIDRLKWEHLIERADFDESIDELGEQIKANWWAENREHILGHING
ncbi:MAG: hypothetical protein H7319_16915 [Spirosoma sp.]|nr:hypothetical protein [Spirosoma sp.]